LSHYFFYRKSYKRSFGQFTDYCENLEIDPYAASPDCVSRYLMHRYQHCGLSRLYVHLSAISHFYRARGLESPCDNSRVKMMMKGIKRQESQEIPIKRVKPLTVKILSESLALLTDNSLVAWRTVWRMHICFFCFLRFDDLKRLKVIEMTISNCLHQSHQILLLGDRPYASSGGWGILLSIESQTRKNQPKQ